jgi:thiol-disulfide isomerase/thioredoxin
VPPISARKSDRPRLRFQAHLPSRALPLLTLLLATLVFLPACSSKPELEKITYEQWKQQIAAHKGGVVVVTVWASWCPSCVETLSSAAEIAQKHAEQGVTAVSLCLNDYTRPPEVAAAEKIIQQQPPAMQNFILKQDIATSLDALSLNDVPAILVVDPAGEIRYRLERDTLTNEISLADVEDAIESLL